MRLRKRLAHYTCRPDRSLTVRKQEKSTFTRTREIVAELGMDIKEYQKEARLRTLFRMAELQLL